MGLLGINVTLHILSFALAVAVLCMAVLFHIRKNYPWTKYYLTFHSALLLILVLNFIRMFVSAMVTYQPQWLFALFLILLYGSLSFLIIFVPYFTTWMIAHPWRNPYKVVFISASTLFFLFSLASIFLYDGLWIQIVLVTIFFGVLIFCIGVLIKNLKTIENRDVRRISKAYVILSLVMIPFMITDTFFTLPPGVITFPVYMFWLSMVIFIYLVNYFLHIPEAPDDVIDPLQLKKFHITGREREIIELIRQGMTTKEIGEKLFISPYTVNNHIANIYEKTGVRSRIDLLNLMKPVF